MGQVVDMIKVDEDRIKAKAWDEVYKQAKESRAKLNSGILLTTALNRILRKQSDN